jgi:hyperosmotically inducible protein
MQPRPYIRVQWSGKGREKKKMKRLTGFQKAAVVGLMLAGLASAKNPNAGTLEDKVRHQLVMLPYYNVFDNLSFRVDDGRVTLFGQVTQPVLKSDAQNAVKHVEGVTAVDNEIEVLPLSPFDNQIRRATYFAIYGFGPLERYGTGTQPSIRILVKNGNVTLAGVVNSETDRSLAALRANRVPGVFSVSNELVVER